MFRSAIIAIAATGLLAACSHTQQTEDQQVAEEDPNAASTYATPRRAEPRKARVDDSAKADADNMGRDADNTGKNERDRDGATLTPMDQGNSGTDLKITQEIRKAVVGADGLSFTAKNVKIITRDANVTLRGPVKTSSEKQRIDELARSCAGVARVDNQLEVESTN